jgi:PRTRC genetic system protein A
MFNNLVTYLVHKTDPLPLSDAQAYQYVLAANGLFLRAETRFWRACLPLARCRVRGLQPLRPHFELKVRCLPDALLCEVVSDARRQRRGDGLNEALYRFRHDGRRIRVIRPAQRATPGSVQTEQEHSPDTILELHSHGNMAAFWSATDDRDEQGACLYGVIGRLDSRPEILLRAGIYGYRFPLPLSRLFAGNGGCVETATVKRPLAPAAAILPHPILILEDNHEPTSRQHH